MTTSSSSSSSSSTTLQLGKLGAGLMQWGTTDLDNRVVNPKGNLKDDEVQHLWKTCRDHQVIFFDTAEGYGGGTSEQRVQDVRRWYETSQGEKEKEDNEEQKVIVATKFLPTLWRWTKASFYKSLRGSLERLGVDCIDLYFLHTPIHPLPIETFMEWMCQAVDDGLIRHIGISNCNADLTLRAHKVAQKNGKRIACNQIMLNLLVWNSQKHQETVQLCHDLKIQIVAYSPIGQGLLTDALTQEKFASIRAVKMTGVHYDELQPLRDEIYKISQSRRQSQNRNQDQDTSTTTMAQVAMTWVRGHGAIPLVGCRNVSQMEDAIASTTWDLTPEEIAALDKLSLGSSIFERPLYRRGLFVVFISLLQMFYNTEQRYKAFMATWFSNSSHQKSVEATNTVAASDDDAAAGSVKNFNTEISHEDRVRRIKKTE